MASLRATIPRASLALHSKQLQHRRLSQTVRYASATPPPPPKPRVLEKPERFNPPSHPSRLRTKPRYTGPPLSEHERQKQQVRKYPHMMPPEGSLTHWLLTNRTLHLYITLGVLISLVLAVWFTDFMTTTPYRQLLPPNSMFFAHPFAFIGRYIEVYQMHVAYISAETAERRRQKVDDVKKRAQYRKAHGIDSGESVLGGWTARADGEEMGPALREGAVEFGNPGMLVPKKAMEVASVDAPAESDRVEGEEAAETFVDFEGKRQPIRKKWLGIW